MHGGRKGLSLESTKGFWGNTAPGLIGLKGKTLYVGGTDDYFRKSFTPDPSDIALKTNQKLKVYGSRLGATGATVREQGLGNLMKSNKGRVGAGLGILAVGGAGTAYLASQGVKNISQGRAKSKYKLTAKHKRSISRALRGKKRRRNR